MEIKRDYVFFVVSVVFLIDGTAGQFRDKNISQETDAVQALLAKYLQRRLQGNQHPLLPPPPPSVLFSTNHHQAKARQATRRQNDLTSSHYDNERKERKERREEYDDYEDDLQGIEDSDRGRTRIDLLAVVGEKCKDQNCIYIPKWNEDAMRYLGSGSEKMRIQICLLIVIGLFLPSQTIPGRLNDDCPNCVDEHAGGLAAPSRWTMPLLKLGEKRYYLGIFFKANWYRAAQYCRYHGMHLASIASQEENDRLEKHIKDFGLGHEHFWTSGTDQAEEGTFFWMANGRPITFENWNVGEPNNFRYENGEEEHCLELWNRDGKGLKWNDSPCSFETYFVCEVQ